MDRTDMNVFDSKSKLIITHYILLKVRYNFYRCNFFAIFDSRLVDTFYLNVLKSD